MRTDGRNWNYVMILITQVSKTFKQLTAVSDVSLHIEKGEYVALLGPNGAGKTTLVEMIEGIQTPDHGEIRVMGKTWADNAHELRQNIGISLQETKLIDRLTVLETLSLFGDCYGVTAKHCMETLDRIGLAHKAKSYVHQLSGGQQQKVALGLAFLHNPQLLILDEPTTGLDPNSRREIWDILNQFKSQHVTMILTTHYMEEAQTLCDRIVMMNQGKIIADGSFNALITEFAAYEEIRFGLEPSDLPLPELHGIPGYISIDWNAGILRVNDVLRAVPAFISAMETHHLRLNRLECRRLTLDDLFTTLTGRALHD